MLHLVFAFFLSFVSSKDALIATNTFHNGVDMFQDCDAYNDCYNCTLSKCSWSGSTCENPKGRTSPREDLSVGVFLEEARKCGDARDLCGFH